MKLLIVFVFIAVVAAAPQSQDVQVVKLVSDNDGLGTYNFEYEQSDGSKRQEKGELRNVGAEDEFVAMSGSYTWVGPDGVTYIVKYIADENGFQPTIEQGPGGAVPAGVVASLLG
ncbi:unnamed protein product [Arctia plantaginis]|uniref:Uncharacterized protein n=1 Tax=Arctia plantaginis TaxID=874455 RepID=A0A8S1AF82_ARCPL|nr:unnamed protein product [Arctia plantaginis]CAB3243656.1 unnamed protein product [Arctia plantaginis]